MEIDYKKKYLETAIKALQMEASLLQTRFEVVRVQIPEAIEELKAYEEEVKKE